MQEFTFLHVMFVVLRTKCIIQMNDLYIFTNNFTDIYKEKNAGERTTYSGTIYNPQSADCDVYIDNIKNIFSLLLIKVRFMI